MTEKEFISKIKQLRQIKPDPSWVSLTKNRILGQKQCSVETNATLAKEASFISVLRSLFLRSILKPAYAGLLILFIFFGLFGFAQNSVPGDYFYPLKKIAERSRVFFASDQERAQLSLDLAKQRLEELTQIVDKNQTRKLAPAIREFQASLDKAVVDSSSVKKVVEISKKAKELEARGVVFNQEGVQRLEMESLVNVLENLINDLENRSLTEDQQKLLSQIEELVKRGEYGTALELYLTNQ